MGAPDGDFGAGWGVGEGEFPAQGADLSAEIRHSVIPPADPLGLVVVNRIAVADVRNGWRPVGQASCVAVLCGRIDRDKPGSVSQRGGDDADAVIDLAGCFVDGIVFSFRGHCFFFDGDAGVAADPAERHIPDQLTGWHVHAKHPIWRAGHGKCGHLAIEWHRFHLLNPRVQSDRRASRAEDAHKVAVGALAEVGRHQQHTPVLPAIRNDRSSKKYRDFGFSHSHQLIAAIEPQRPGRDIQRQRDLVKHHSFRRYRLRADPRILRWLADGVTAVLVGVCKRQAAKIADIRFTSDQRPCVGVFSRHHQQVPVFSRGEIHRTEGEPIAADHFGCTHSGLADDRDLPTPQVQVCLARGHGQPGSPDIGRLGVDPVIVVALGGGGLVHGQSAFIGSPQIPPQIKRVFRSLGDQRRWPQRQPSTHQPEPGKIEKRQKAGVQCSCETLHLDITSLTKSAAVARTNWGAY